MTWTIVCDLPFRRYQGNVAIDMTDFHNNAQILGNAIAHEKYITFQNPQDQLLVTVKDDSLQRFTGLMVEAVIKPEDITRRFNIVEGSLSFAFFIESDRRLFGTVFDGQYWVPVTSDNVLVPSNEWSRVSFEYDGICIGKLTLNGKKVGTNINMPMGMRQPNHYIGIGHWPNADGRYTFIGEMGHVRISRRDYEDFWRDTVMNAFCQRRLSPRQADAMQELRVMMDAIDPKTKEAIRECAKKQSKMLVQLLRKLRAGNMRNIAVQRQLGKNLREAWCCDLDALKAKQILVDFFRTHAGEPNSEQRADFLNTLDEFRKITAMCERKTPPFDRMEELLLTALPELSSVPEEMEQIIQLI